MPAGSDSDRGGERFERGLYVGLAAAAAAAGMTTAAYLATRQAFKYYKRHADVSNHGYDWKQPTMGNVPTNFGGQGASPTEEEAWDIAQRQHASLSSNKTKPATLDI